MRIAVIGAGIAGITAAHHLSRRHEVTLFDKNDYVGGHTNTVVIADGPDAGTAVDTGFIVFNDATYPNFVRFLRDLQVAGRPSVSSYGYHDSASGLQFAGHSLATLFAQPANLLNLSFLRMVFEILRFNASGRRAIRDGSAVGQTLGEYCRQRRYSSYFQRHYLQPLGAALWSTRPDEISDFPAEAFLRFFQNHGLLTLWDMPMWRTVVGGSHAYVKAFLSLFEGHLHTSAAIEAVSRRDDQVQVRLDGETRIFDRVVLACHADQALRLLADPSPTEQALLGAWQYQENHTVLHTDESVLPPLRKVWSAWNSARRSDSSEGVFATYDMNRLQGLQTRGHYLVTLNGGSAIRQERILAEFTYHHPAYTMASLATQRRLPDLNGVRGTYFCGSYFGNGFHEDAVVSALAVVEAIP